MNHLGLISICFLLTFPLSAQGQETLRVLEVQVRLGMSVQEVQALFPESSQSDDGSEISISSTRKFGELVLPIEVGRLYIAGGLVIGVCRSWIQNESTDSELARILFGAATSVLNGSTMESATIRTNVARLTDQTIEELEIQAGNRSLAVTRTQHFNINSPIPPFVDLRECLMSPGMRLELPSK